MSKLHALTGTLLWVVSFGAYAHCPLACSYYLDGHDAGDGMGAMIDFETRRLSVAGDMFVLDPCHEARIGVCFSSDYMSFKGPSADARSWTHDGSKFLLKGHRKLVLARDEICADVIHSTQKVGEFEFIFSDKHGLLGWRLSYQTLEGEPATYEYLLPNLSLAPAN